MYLSDLLRKLTAEQKELVLSLAETDKETEERISGTSSEGKSSKNDDRSRIDHGSSRCIADKPKEEDGFFKKIKRALFD